MTRTKSTSEGAVETLSALFIRDDCLRIFALLGPLLRETELVAACVMLAVSIIAAWVVAWNQPLTVRRAPSVHAHLLSP